MKGVKESGKGSGGNRKERILGRRKKGVRRKENSRMKVGKRGGGGWFGLVSALCMQLSENAKDFRYLVCE